MNRDTPLVAALGLILVVGLSSWELVADIRQPAAGTSDPSVAAAVRTIRAGFEAGDVIVVVPSWDERPWAGLTGIGAGTDTWPFEALWGPGHLDAADLLRFDRAWVLGTFGREPTLPLAASDMTLSETRDLGQGVALRRYRLPGWRPLARLTESLEQAQVTRLPTAGGQPRACRWRKDHHECGLDAWLDVRLERRDVGHRDTAWVYTHPGPGSARTRITWGEVPAGGAALLRFGFTQAATRHDEGSVTEVVVRLGEAIAETVRLSPTDYQVRRLLVRAATAAPLAVEVAAEDPRWRELMLQIDLMDAVPASLDPERGPRGEQ